MKPAEIESFFATLQAANPHPETELEYTTPFELLTAVLLSAQATDVGVNKATRKLFPVANTPQAILDLGIEGLSEYIKTIGLYKSKAKHLMETCRMLLEQHGGEVPRTREALEALPGVSAKVDLDAGTAVVTLSQDVPDQTLRDAVTDAGYQVTGIE